MPTEEPTNLRRLSPSRARLHAGDVFALGLPDDTFLFGRVISTSACWAVGHPPSANLVYVYRHRTTDMTAVPDRSLLRPGELLVPPVLINRLPWSRGYFAAVGTVPLDAADVLPVHCFWSASRRKYYDEAGRELPGPVEPVGVLGLASYRTVDDAVSTALGIPLAP